MNDFNSPDARLVEYEDLLVRREEVLKLAGSFLTTYTQEFGELIRENFELKVECIKVKKTISYCRRRMNRGLAVDVAKMKSEIEGEMKLYYMQLESLKEENEAAKNAKTIDEFRLSRAKKIYRRLAKKMHPDIFPKTSENETLQELWEKIVHAYHHSNVDELEDLEVLVRKEMEALGEEASAVEINDIEARIERLERQINDIITTEPYTYGELLADEERKKAMHEQLEMERDDYTQYRESLERALEEMLKDGGVKMIWTMN